MPKHTENALTDRKILNAKSKDKQYKISKSRLHILQRRRLHKENHLPAVSWTSQDAGHYGMDVGLQGLYIQQTLTICPGL